MVPETTADEVSWNESVMVTPGRTSREMRAGRNPDAETWISNVPGASVRPGPAMSWPMSVPASLNTLTEIGTDIGDGSSLTSPCVAELPRAGQSQTVRVMSSDELRAPTLVRASRRMPTTPARKFTESIRICGFTRMPQRAQVRASVSLPFSKRT